MKTDDNLVGIFIEYGNVRVELEKAHRTFTEQSKKIHELQLELSNKNNAYEQQRSWHEEKKREVASLLDDINLLANFIEEHGLDPAFQKWKKADSGLVLADIRKAVKRKR